MNSLFFHVACRESHLEIVQSGFHSVTHSREKGTVAFLSDYPLGDLTSLGDAVLEQGLHALRNLPENTLAFVARHSGEMIEHAGVRDTLGNTPLYGLRHGDDTLFASSLPQLRAQWTEWRPEIDQSVLSEYLLFRYAAGPRTLIRGLRQPLAAHALVFRDGREEQVRIVDIRESFCGRRFEDIEAKIADAMARSLSRERDFDTQGIMFSGGLDSCFLAYGSDFPERRLYTLAFPREGRTDLEAAIGESAHLHLPFTPIEIDRRRYASQLPHAITRFGWPIDHPNFVGRDLLFRAAAADGVTRVLTGDGSDSVFGGAWYVALSKLLLAKEWTPRLLVRLPIRGRVIQKLRQAVETPTEHLIIFDKTYYSQQRALELSGGTLDDVSHLRDHLAEVATFDPLDQAFYLAFLTTLSVYPSAQRGMAWASGVDAGYPFLAQELVWLANAVPGRERVRGFIAKRLLQKAARAVVPERIIRRKKYGLPVPLTDFLLGDGGLRRYDALLQSRDSVVSTLLDPRALTQLLGRVGSPDQTRDDLELYWVVLNLELWGRLHIRGESIE